MLSEQEETDLVKFATTMRVKLIKNITKGGWDNDAPFRLLCRANDEFEELQVAFESNDLDAIIEECADTANFLMMVASNVRRLRDGIRQQP